MSVFVCAGVLEEEISVSFSLIRYRLEGMCCRELHAVVIVRDEIVVIIRASPVGEGCRRFLIRRDIPH